MNNNKNCYSCNNAIIENATRIIIDEVVYCNDCYIANKSHIDCINANKLIIYTNGNTTEVVSFGKVIIYSDCNTQGEAHIRMNLHLINNTKHNANYKRAILQVYNYNNNCQTGFGILETLKTHMVEFGFRHGSKLNKQLKEAVGVVIFNDCHKIRWGSFGISNDGKVETCQQ